MCLCLELLRDPGDLRLDARHGRAAVGHAPRDAVFEVDGVLSGAALSVSAEVSAPVPDVPVALSPEAVRQAVSTRHPLASSSASRRDSPRTARPGMEVCIVQIPPFLYSAPLYHKLRRLSPPVLFIFSGQC